MRGSEFAKKNNLDCYLLILWAVIGAFFVLIISSQLQAASEVFPETEIRKQLNHLFFSEQYILDIKKIAEKTPLAQDKAPLPGLAFISPDSQGANDKNAKTNYDLLLVLDSSISEVRRKIATEIVNRQLEASKLDKVTKLEVRRQTILKVSPPELAPLGPKGNPTDQDSGQKSAKTAEPNKPEEKHEQSLYDFIENKRDLATKAFLVLWASIASLVVLLGLIAKSKSGGLGGKSSTNSSMQNGGKGNIHADSPSESSASNSDKNGGRRESTNRPPLTRDELFSKDAALFKQIQEIVEEANAIPLKVAQILSRWLDTSDEYARYASVFLKNCDIRTTENICKHLHPSDIEKLVTRSLTEFEPFSEENRRVLELMRSDLAIMAARQSIKEKISPLTFLKTLSEDDLARLLEHESIKDIAMIATQVPVHRLSKYLENTPNKTYKELMTVVANLKDLKPDDFSQLKSRLEEKIAQFSDIVVTKEQRILAMKQLIAAAKDPLIQEEVAKDVFLNHNLIYKNIRQSVFLVSDILNLPSRATKILFQSIDGEILATALAGISIDREQLLISLPEAVRESFKQVQPHSVEPKARIASWAKINDLLEEMRNNGLIAVNEIRQAQIKTDNSFSKTNSQSDADNNPGEARNVA